MTKNADPLTSAIGHTVNVGDGVSRDPELATGSQQPQEGATEPLARNNSAKDPSIQSIEHETLVGDSNQWSRQEISAMRQEQTVWMKAMTERMNSFFNNHETTRAASGVNFPGRGKTISDMVSDGPYGPQKFYADLVQPTTRGATPLSYPNGDDMSNDDTFADIDPVTQAKLMAWLKAAKKVTMNGSSRGIFSGAYWEVWRKEMTLTLQEADLFKFCRPNFIIPTDSGSFLKLQFDHGDQLASRFIMKCVSLELAQEMAYMTTSQQMWTHLITTQESKTVNERNAMLTSWESLRQESHEKMAAYIRRLDLLACQLNEKGRYKDDVDKLHKLLAGLSEGWVGERTSLEVCANFTPYNEMCAILQGIAVRRGETTGDVILGGEAHVTTQERRPFSKRTGNTFTKRCLGCGLSTHVTDSCPKVTLKRDTAGQYIKVCWHCSSEGHTLRNCPSKGDGVVDNTQA
jgi:hypothetical protein